MLTNFHDEMFWLGWIIGTTDGSTHLGITRLTYNIFFIFWGGHCMPARVKWGRQHDNERMRGDKISTIRGNRWKYSSAKQSRKKERDKGQDKVVYDSTVLLVISHLWWSSEFLHIVMPGEVVITIFSLAPKRDYVE